MQKIYAVLFTVLFLALFTCSRSFGQDSSKTNFKGLGINYKSDTPRKVIMVTSVFAGNAGAEAGLRVDDLLLSINDKPLWPMSTEERSKALRGGDNGTPYVLKIERTLITSLGNKQQVKDVNISPREISLTTCLSGDCQNGMGKLMNNSSGIALEGRFENGKLVEGKTYFRSGRIRSEGRYKNGLLEGPDCASYYDAEYSASMTALQRKGQFIAGMLRKGASYSADGKSMWRGSFDEKGNPHGKDFYINRPDFYYEGDVVNGELTGDAKSMTYEKGRYEGPVVKGKPEGKGVWYYSGKKHKGRFVNGLMEGQFQVTEKTGQGKYHHVYNYRNGVQR